MNENVNDMSAVGPSDSSDTGADLIGTGGGKASIDQLIEDQEAGNSEALVLGRRLDSSDRNGTGERMTAGTSEVKDAADIGFDRVVDASEAGLGGGLDQAEEAQLGITDEEIARLASRRTR